MAVPDPRLAERWRTDFATWHSSGLSVAAFCRSRDLNLSSFYRWRKIFDLDRPAATRPRSEPDPLPVQSFVPVRVIAAATGTVLVLHDTTEFSFTRNTPEGVGYLSYVKGRHGTHTARGVLLHSSLAVTTDGLPLGLATAKFWTRKTFKGTNARKRTVNPTTVPIEEKLVQQPR